jgi:hypothetical protein
MVCELFKFCIAHSICITPEPIVLLDHPDHVFHVEIEQNKSVAALKKAIRDEMRPAFDHILVTRLDLWKASLTIPLNDHADTQLSLW